MVSNQYLETYLHDIKGMGPQDALAYLRASLVSSYIRSMRVVYDIPYDPDTHQPVYDDDREEGRLTVKTKDGYITDAILEHGWHRLRPRAWGKDDDTIRVYFRTFAWGNGETRREIPVAQPQRGWFINSIEGLNVADDPTRKLPARIKFTPHFEAVTL